MDHFLLAIALMCSEQRTLYVTRMIDAMPTTYEQCTKREQDSRVRELFLNPIKGKTRCEEILLCVQVGWELPD